MDTQRLRRIVELAGPIIEDWVRQSPAHRALTAEIAAWLHAAAQDDVLPAPVRITPPATPAPKPAPAPTPAPAPAPGSKDLLDKMIADLAKPGRANGGLAPAPLSAPGVRPIVSPPPKPSPAPTPAKTTKPPDTAERRTAADLAMQKATFHRRQMDKCLLAKDHAAAVLHLGRVVSTIDAWIASGGDACDERAHGVIAGALAVLPSRDSLPRETEQALDRLARRMDEAEEEEEPATNGDVRAAAARLLNGKTAVLIGGDVREARRVALERELGLGELRWIRSTPTNPALRFEPDLKKPDVAVVLLAIRWVRHATGYAVADACAKARKPLVRLPGGLGTNTVAAAIMNQAAATLA